MNKSVVNNLINDIYKFIYTKNNFDEYYDETGKFDFKKLVDDFKSTIISKIGKKQFIRILQHILLADGIHSKIMLDESTQESTTISYIIESVKDKIMVMELINENEEKYNLTIE